MDEEGPPPPPPPPKKKKKKKSKMFSFCFVFACHNICPAFTGGDRRNIDFHQRAKKKSRLGQIPGKTCCAPPPRAPPMNISLNVNKSFGFDSIPARLLKDAADYIASPLSYIFNMSLSKGVFPDAMKIAKVTPVYKKGEKDILGNYRPISVLPLLAKVLEKIINKQ